MILVLAHYNEKGVSALNGFLLACSAIIVKM